MMAVVWRTAELEPYSCFKASQAWPNLIYAPLLSVVLFQFYAATFVGVWGGRLHRVWIVPLLIGVFPIWVGQLWRFPGWYIEDLTRAADRCPGGPFGGVLFREREGEP